MSFAGEAVAADVVIPCGGYRLDDDDGEVMVAQLLVGRAAFWVQEDVENSPDAFGQGSVRMILTVDDPDEQFKRAITAGPTEVAPVEDAHRCERAVCPTRSVTTGSSASRS